MGAIRHVRLEDGKRIAQHDSANDWLHPKWEDVYPVVEIDGKTVARCVIVAHRDNWEVGVTEDGRVTVGAHGGRVYSMPIEVAKNIEQLLGSAIPEAELLREKRGQGRGGMDNPI